MKQAVIIYQSKTGITKKYAEEIGQFLSEKGVKTNIHPVSDYQDGVTDQADLVFIGCWTAGLMLFLQHPEKTWTDFARKLPALKDKKTVLFTTYKLATGSMFNKQVLTGLIG